MPDQPKFVVAPDQISCDLAGEAAILNLQTGIYYGLDPVGASIWNQLQTPKTLADLRDAILAEYDVEPARCEHDLQDLLDKLAAQHLIQTLVKSSS